MAVTHEQLAKIINRSKELCSESGDRLINEHVNNKNNSFDDPDPASFDYIPMESIFNEDEYEINEDAFQNSKLPENIKNSLKNYQIRPKQSVLDELNVNPERRKKSAVNESRQQAHPMTAGQSVDYSIIKAIVNECLNEYFKNNSLNESALKGIGLKGGTITLVDNKGTTYKAKLEKVGNVND